jgi:hypothetical protein
MDSIQFGSFIFHKRDSDNEIGLEIEFERDTYIDQKELKELIAFLQNQVIE